MSENDCNIYAQPASALTYTSTPPRVGYVDATDVANYVAGQAPGVKSNDVEWALGLLGWEDGDTVADALDRAIQFAIENA